MDSHAIDCVGAMIVSERSLLDWTFVSIEK